MNNESSQNPKGTITLKNSDIGVTVLTLRELLDVESSNIQNTLNHSMSFLEFSLGRRLVEENPESYYLFIKEQSFANLLAKFHPYLSFTSNIDSSFYLTNEMKFYRHISSAPLRTMQDYYSGMAEELRRRYPNESQDAPLQDNYEDLFLEKNYKKTKKTRK